MTKGAWRERRRLIGRLGWLLLVPVLAGCGSGKGTVSGKVIFKDKGLPGGRITFRPADPKQNSVTVPIDPDGNYEAKLPAGEMLVSIDNRELAPPPATTGLRPTIPGFKLPRSKPNDPPAEPSPSAAQKLPGEYKRIPEKYYDVDKSGLTFTVEGGTQKKDFELK